jgi:hypothetical protein
VTATGGAWLDPCKWPVPSNAVTLTTAQPTIGVTISLQRGATLPIQIDDPGQLLERHEGKTPGARLLLGVAGPGLVFHTIPVVAKNSNGRQHQLVVPYNIELKLVIQSTYFRVTDALGVVLDRNFATRISLNVPTGQPPPLIRLAVAGTD